ncbi:MAG: M2 family metallopeptidase [Actinomycetota bacterium]
MVTVPPHRLARSLEEKLSALEIGFHDAYWESQVHATTESESRRADLELQLRRVKGDPEALLQVNEALREELHEPVLKRQLEVLRRSLIANQMDDDTRQEVVALASAVETEFATFRPEIDGRRVSDNDILDILITSNDESTRRRAWEASKEIGARVDDRVRDLARLRNQAAHDQGYADYYRMSLELAEISEEWLYSFLDDVERLTRGPFASYKSALDDRVAQRFGVDTVYPWHYADPFFQEVPPDGRIDLDPVLGSLSSAGLAAQTFAGWGIDLTKVLERSDLYPRERKCQHAFCLDIDRTGNDVRILGNIVPGEFWTSIMLHESGHAAYDLMIDPKLPYLLHRPAHTFVTEAMAVLAGRLVRDPKWLVDVVGIDPPKVAGAAQDLQRTNAVQELLMARWVLVVAHFERELYSDPESDLDSLWWEMVERFQLVTPPPGRDQADWASKIHVAVVPVYYHNYLLGSVLSCQLESEIVADCGGLTGERRVGEWLIERLFRPGHLMRWDALVEQAMGRPLTAEDFARYVGLVGA